MRCINTGHLAHAADTAVRVRAGAIRASHFSSRSLHPAWPHRVYRLLLRLGLHDAWQRVHDDPDPDTEIRSFWAECYAKCYMLYVLTRHHNRLDLSVWRASLTKQENLVRGVLHKFKTL